MDAKQLLVLQTQRGAKIGIGGDTSTRTIDAVIRDGRKAIEEQSDKYRELASKEDNIIFGGRLAEYKYYDMDDVIKSAFDTYNKQ